MTLFGLSSSVIALWGLCWYISQRTF